jgi:hypothetical protein
VRGTHVVYETGLLPSYELASVFSKVCQFVLHAAEVATQHVFAGMCMDVFAGVACPPPPQPAGSGTLVHQKSVISVRVRAFTPTLEGYLAVLDGTGRVVLCVRAALSPLFHHVYLAVSAAGVHAFTRQLVPAALDEVAHAVRALEHMSTAGFHGLALPPLPQLSEGALYPTLFYSCLDTPSLFAAGASVLRACVASPTVGEWVASMESAASQAVLPLSPVCIGYWLAKCRHLTLGLPSAESVTLVEQWRQAAHAAAPNALVGEMEGLVFDLVLEDTTLDQVPPYLHPTTFCDDVQGAGYLTVLYLLQWRQTLRRLVEVAQERAAELDLLDPALLTRLCTTMRVGILSQGERCKVVKSMHRDLGGGQHTFLINLDHHVLFQLTCKSTLQQQRAEDRNVVVAYFIGEALKLLGPLLCPRESTHAVATLSQGYFGALKPKALTNLAKVYERMQGVVRKFRQEVSSLKQLQQGRAKGKRKCEE